MNYRLKWIVQRIVRVILILFVCILAPLLPVAYIANWAWDYDLDEGLFYALAVFLSFILWLIIAMAIGNRYQV